MIRYSCHSENFGIRPAPETFSFIRALGFDCIDVASRSLIPQSGIVEDPSGCAARFRKLSEQHDLPLSELFLSDVHVSGKPVSPVFAGTCRSEFDSNFRAICRFAKEAGFRSIMGGAGRAADGLSFSECFSRAAETLARQTETAAQYGLAFHVEPSRQSLLNTVDAALEMTERAPGLRYTLDFLHYHVNSVPLSESIRLIPLAGHLHMRQARKAVGKCDFAEGEIDYPAIVRELKRNAWDGDIAMEFWRNRDLDAEGIQPVEQNIVMRYALKTWFRTL